MRWRILIAALALAACQEEAPQNQAESSALLESLAARTKAAGKPAVPAVPSGMAVGLQEVVEDVRPDGEYVYARFRFVAPSIAGSKARGLETRATDMEFLCNEYALKVLGNGVAKYDRISISLADRETEFGVSNAQATQFFELFRVENGACIWEDF